MPLIITYGLGSIYGRVAQLMPTYGYGDPGPLVINCNHVISLDSVELFSETDRWHLKVRFVGIPKKTAAFDGAYFIGNYTIKKTGTNTLAPVTITQAQTDPTDDEVIILSFDSELPNGDFTLFVNANLTSNDNGSIVGPLSTDFSLTWISQDDFDQGGKNSTTEDSLRNFLNPTLSGKGWDSIVAALAVGDESNNTNAQKAFSQLFRNSASGIYLDRLSSDQGIKRPLELGIDDSTFRKFSINSSTNKLTQNSLLSIMETFYGFDAVRAYCEAELYEPYVLVDGTRLVIEIDEEETHLITFKRSDFNILRRATAIEVASVITRELKKAGSNSFALAKFDPEAKKSKVRIYSGSKGLGSSISVQGLEANRSFWFNDNIFLSNASTWATNDITWKVEVLLEEKVKISKISPSSLNQAELELVRPGDYVLINSYNFDELNWGAFEILEVDYNNDYFIIKNPLGVDQLTVAQCFYTDVMFFRPTKRTIYDSPRWVLVSQHSGILDVVLHATSQAVNRSKINASYAVIRDSVPVSTFARDENGLISISTVPNHGLNVGDHFYIDGINPVYDKTLTAPTVTAAVPSGNYVSEAAAGTLGVSTKTIKSISNTFKGVYGTCTKLTNGNVLFLGGRLSAGGVASSKITAEYYKPLTSTTYRWQRDGVYGNIPSGSHGNQFIAACELQDGYHRGRVLKTGGAFDIEANYSSNYIGVTGEIYDVQDLPAGPFVSFNIVAGCPGVAAHDQVVADSAGLVLLSGGCEIWNVATKKAHAWTSNGSYYGGTWGALADMNEARLNHKLIPIANKKVLAVGGRQPFSYLNNGDIISEWRFDETGVIASDHSGNGLTIDITGLTRKPGRAGHCIQLNTPVSTVAGAPQTALNASLLLPNWTIQGWVSSAVGTIFSNSIAGATSADNTLVAFRRTASNFEWYWHKGTGVTVSGSVLNNNLNATRPNHIALVKKDSHVVGKSHVYFYLNGDLVSVWWDMDEATGGANGLWRFGTDVHAGGFGTNFTENVDEFTIHNTARIPEQFSFPSTGARLAYTGYTLADIGKVAYNGSTNAGYYILKTLPGTNSSDWQLTTVTQQINNDYHYQIGSIVMPDNSFVNGEFGRFLNTCEEYNVLSNTWTKRPSMTYARANFDHTIMPNGDVLIAGGMGYDPGNIPNVSNASNTPITGPINVLGNHLNTLELYNIQTNQWSLIKGPNDEKVMYCKYLPKTGRVYCVSYAKEPNFNPTYTVWSANPNDFIWNKIDQNNAEEVLYYGYSVVLNDGNWLLAGGLSYHLTSLYEGTDVITISHIIDPGNDQFADGGINTLAKVEVVPNSTNFQYRSIPDFNHITKSNDTYSPDGRIIPFKAPISLVHGPYIFDTKGGVGIRFGVGNNIEATVMQDLNKGFSYNKLTLNVAINFPNEPGILIFNFGKDKAVYPVKYFSRISSTELSLDGGFRFPESVKIGDKVNLLIIASAYVPKDLDIGAFYLTASATGRIVAEQAIEDDKAAGIVINKTVIYPSDVGLGGQGYPARGNYKLSDKVQVWGGNDLDEELKKAKE